MQVSTELRDQIRASINDAYYEARNDGSTMDAASHNAADAVVTVLENTQLIVATTVKIV